MVRLSLTIPDEVAARFDRAASPLGGRAKLLRRLVMQAISPGAPAVEVFKPGLRPVDFRVRLGPKEAAHALNEAQAMGMGRATWASALLRRHLLGRPRFPRAGELAIFAIHAELRRLRRDLGEMAQALGGAAGQEGLQASAIEDLRADIERHMARLRKAIEGNLQYWDVAR